MQLIFLLSWCCSPSPREQAGLISNLQSPGLSNYSDLIWILAKLNFSFESISSEKLTASLLPGTQIHWAQYHFENLSNKTFSLQTITGARIWQISQLKCCIVLTQLYPQAKCEPIMYKEILISIILLAAERVYSLFFFFLIQVMQGHVTCRKQVRHTAKTASHFTHW